MGHEASLVGAEDSHCDAQKVDQQQSHPRHEPDEVADEHDPDKGQHDAASQAGDEDDGVPHSNVVHQRRSVVQHGRQRQDTAFRYELFVYDVVINIIMMIIIIRMWSFLNIDVVGFILFIIIIVSHIWSHHVIVIIIIIDDVRIHLNPTLLCLTMNPILFICLFRVYDDSLLV